MKKNLERRVRQIEAREEINAKALSKRLTKLEVQVYCGITTGHQHITLIRKKTYGSVFRCINCNLEYFRDVNSLTEKETKLVTIIFTKQKKGKI